MKGISIPAPASVLLAGANLVCILTSFLLLGNGEYFCLPTFAGIEQTTFDQLLMSLNRTGCPVAVISCGIFLVEYKGCC